MLQSMELQESDMTEWLNNNNYYYYLPGDTMVKNLPANAGDIGDVIRSLCQVRSPGGGNVKPLQFSCLENLLDTASCLAPVHRVTKSQTQLSHRAHQFNSVAQLCMTLCDPMDCSTPGLPVHHQLPEFTQTHVH